jgi:hypothetical protein
MVDTNQKSSQQETAIADWNPFNLKAKTPIPIGKGLNRDDTTIDDVLDRLFGPLSAEASGKIDLSRAHDVASKDESKESGNFSSGYFGLFSPI